LTKDYVKAHIANQKAKGLKELRRLWARPEDEAEIRALAAKLTARALQRKRTKGDAP